MTRAPASTPVPAAAPPSVKGRCPGAHAPMMAGDGLIVRIRPRSGRLEAGAVLGLCALAERFGKGAMELTNRANLQIRGVAPEAHEALLLGLEDLGLLDPDADVERRRNLIVDPFAPLGGLSHRLAQALTEALPRLPALPPKIGFAVDAGPAPRLRDASADLRFETGPGGLILRADGAAGGRPVTEAQAVPALIDMAEWLAERLSPEARRMAQVQAIRPLPAVWTRATAPRPAPRPSPGPNAIGFMLGAPFGRLPAKALATLMRDSGAPALRLTPWRLFLLEGAAEPPRASVLSTESPFLAEDSALLRVHACPGAPFCGSAGVETRALAARLAPRMKGSLHVSGCAKGCAKASPSDVTLVGRDGAFDLVRGGRAGDAPSLRGLSPDALLDAFS
ncbi:MAG: cobalamin biosynthesis protein CobG [Pseudomonadota bacterium]